MAEARGVEPQKPMPSTRLRSLAATVPRPGQTHCSHTTSDTLRHRFQFQYTLAVG